MRRMSLVPAAVLAALVLAASGCSSQGVSGSRHTIYDSYESLAADSAAVVIGRVASQYEDTLEGASVPHTVSVVEVVEEPTVEGVAAKLEANRAVSLSSGTVIEVRQLGGADFEETPAPLMRVGEEYLLFLTPSGLDGEFASQYFVTGANAGLFTIDGDDFTQLTDSPDRFPTSGDLTELD